MGTIVIRPFDEFVDIQFVEPFTLINTRIRIEKPTFQERLEEVERLVLDDLIETLHGRRKTRLGIQLILVGIQHTLECPDVHRIETRILVGYIEGFLIFHKEDGIRKGEVGIVDEGVETSHKLIRSNRQGELGDGMVVCIDADHIQSAAFEVNPIRSLDRSVDVFLNGYLCRIPIDSRMSTHGPMEKINAGHIGQIAKFHS